MASINVLPTVAHVYTDLLGLVPDINCFQADGNYTVVASGGPVGSSYLMLSGFGPALPQDVAIQGVEVKFIAKTDVSNASATSDVWIELDSTRSSTVKSTATFTDSDVTYTLGASNDLWGLTPKRPDLHNNSDLKVFIKFTGTSAVARMLDQVYIIVYYDLNTELTGERSTFPRTVDTIDYKTNGASASNQIKAEDVAKLGDALFTLETTALNPADIVRGIGEAVTSQTTLFFATFTITGNYVFNSGGTSGYLNYFEDITIDPTTGAIVGTPTIIRGYTTTDLEDIGHSGVPCLPQNKEVYCTSTSAIGWIVSGGIKTPIYVSPLMVKIARRINESGNDRLNLQLGFRAYNRQPNLSITTVVSGRNVGSSFVPKPPPNGVLIVKLMAYGEM